VSPLLGRSVLRLSLLLSVAGSAAAQTAPPMARAGDDQILDCVPPGGTDVTLNGTGSFDPDGLPLTYLWTDATLAVLSTEAAPIVHLPPGDHVLTLTVDDVADGPASDDVRITVIADATPPVLVLSHDSAELWPPNHKPHGYAVADLVASVSDDCSDLTVDDVAFARATSDEPDNGKGDGNTSDDVSFSRDCTEADVRAERAGPRDGRVYELFLHVADEAENAGEARFTVSVPHDRAHGAEDSGAVTGYECGDALPICPPAPDPGCSDAAAGEVAIRDKSKGAWLRWRASGFAPGSVSDEGNLLCLYTDGAASGGSPSPDKVRVREKKGQGTLKVATKGSNLEIPALPLASGSVLRLELHDAAGGCVSSSFDAPSVNEASRYEAETN
jgi:hypothetical protein